MTPFTITSLKSKDLYKQFKELNKVVECSEKQFRSIIAKLSDKNVTHCTFKGIKIIKSL